MAAKTEGLRLGVDIDGQMMTLLMYADDVDLIADSEEKLQHMISKVYDWCVKWQMTTNKEKTAVVHFRRTAIARTDFSFKLCSDTIILIPRTRAL